jgi:CDGSH-type Zn-finger protein
MSDVKVRIRDNGPILIEGPVVLLDAEGQAFALDPAKPAIGLCRCGQSHKKPFCDGAHKTCGFAAAERAPRA